MNVLEMLHQELKDKHWTTEEKAYYIYIRSCQLFSYDERYDYCDLFDDEKQLKNKIINRTIDLENVHDFRVICTSHSDEVLSKLLNELIGIDCLSEGDPNLHRWLKFYDGKRYIEADSTAMSDLQRVKMGLKTYGYKPVITDYDFNIELKQMARNNNYIKDEYTNALLDQRKDRMFQDYVAISPSREVSKQSDDYFIYRLNIIKELFDGFNELQRFSDAEFCVSYLFHKFLQDDERHLGNIYLFENVNFEKWNFVNLYPIKLNDDRLYLVLEKNDEKVSLKNISENDAVQYVKTMRGINKDLLHE